MKQDVSRTNEFRKYYLSEFELYNGEEFITFNIVHIDMEKMEIQVTVTDRGKMSLITYDLFIDKEDKLYFEYFETEEGEREFKVWQAERQQKQLNKKLNSKNPVSVYRDNR